MTSRRRPAPAARVLLAGVSVAATLGIVAALGAAAPDPPANARLRVVVTDPRIGSDEAVAAALDAARTGRTIARVPVGAPAQPGGTGGQRVPHTRTSSS